MEIRELTLRLGSEEFSVRHHRPKQAPRRAAIVANGAGSSMESPFIVHFCRELVDSGIYSVSFNFPYQERGRGRPDPGARLEETYLAVAVDAARESGLGAANVVLGGKSMGGRIASQIANRSGATRLFFLGYPLHPPGAPDKLRDSHLYDVKARMLFVGGDRDSFCDPARFAAVRAKLPPHVVHLIPGGDHSFKVPKKSGRTNEEVMAECARIVAEFCLA